MNLTNAMLMLTEAHEKGLSYTLNIHERDGKTVTLPVPRTGDQTDYGEWPAVVAVFHERQEPKTLIQHVRDLAFENPEFVYTPGEGERATPTACSYLPTESNPQGCIIGAALRRYGVSLETLSSCDGDSARTVVPELTEITAGSQEGLWLCQVQAAQDVGRSWSEAVAEADECFPL